MTKILKIIFLLIFFHSDVFSCSCRYETSGYELYYDIKHCFEGTVIKVDKRRFDETITFRINKVYKGRFDTIVQITTSSSASDCGVYLELNKTYLIEAKLFQKKYSTSSCLRNSLKGTERFMEDTMMLNLFSKKNVFVNLPNIRGQIKRGKRVGFGFVKVIQENLKTAENMVFGKKMNQITIIKMEDLSSILNMF